MRILIVTDSYPPELRSAAELMAELAEGLKAKGHDITVATTMPGYNLPSEIKKEEIKREETIRGVRIVRIPVLPHHKVPNIIRGINQVFFLPIIFSRGVKKSVDGKFDWVIVHSPPLPLAHAAGKLAQYYEAHFLTNIHDIFPQNGIDLVSFWQKPLIQFFFGGMERTVYKMAEKIVVPSENHARFLMEKRAVLKEKITVIPHWVNTNTNIVGSEKYFRETWELENKFIFFFGGVLGPSQGLEMVIDVAEKFRNIRDIVFLFVGDGTAKEKLKSIVEEKRLTNVLFKPFISADDYHTLLKQVHIGIATLTAKNTTPAVPAKLMPYMASALPVIVAVHKESDAIRIVNEAKCGFTARSDNREEVLRAFQSAYDARESLRTLGENGKKYAEEYFNREKLIEDWNRILT
jgi:glycosyltransferase involved in cell wall biosynthesis